ncbi:MAG: hypothetical protein DMF68_01270 [Acidobacteria bacterium]|nr:MAG: hypothetical protein DMF68_01270 [Acidobacteriota bacterium]
MRKKRSHIVDDIHKTPDVSHIQNPDVSHEASDVNVRSIIIFAVGLFIFGVIVHILMLLMFNYMEKRAESNEAAHPRGPMAITQKEMLPPEPRLQLAPGFGVGLGEGKERINLQLKEPNAEYKELRKIWDDELQGKPDPGTGKTSMPIDEAMKKIVQDGQLRARTSAQGQQQIDIHGGMDMPSFMSSGRMGVKRDQ